MSTDHTPALTLEALLEKIDRIVVENDYIRDAIRAIGGNEESAEEIVSDLASIVQVRETTNQQIIALYSKMYDDLRPDKMRYLQQVAECYRNAKDEDIPFLQETVEKMLGLPTDD